MPYSRVDLINAFRAENPDAKDIPDNKIFAAIAVEDPELAKGISELQPPASPDRSLTNPNVIGPLLGGVGPTALGDRIMGSVASVVNGLFPGGDTKRNIPTPAMTPDQEIGAKAVTVAGAADLAGSIASKARNAIAESDVPRKMLQRAEDIRTRPSTPPPPVAIPTSKYAATNMAIRQIASRHPIAAVEESIGNALSGPDRMPLTRAEVAADEAARMAQINRNPPVVQDAAPAAPALNVPRPTTPQFVQNQLDQARAAETPEQLYARQQAVRDAEIPPREASAETPLNVPRPGLSPIDEDILFKRAQVMGTLKAPEVNKWLGVRPDDVTHGANPGQQVLDEGLLGPTKEATQANVATSLKNAGMQLEARLKTADAKGLTIDAQTPVYDAAASATKRIGAPKDATFSAQLNGVVDDIEAKYPDLGKLKPSDAHKLKVELGNSIDWKNSDNPVNQMMKQIYRSINSSIGSVDETIAPAQRRWGNLYIADRTLKTGIAKDLVGKGTGPQPVQKFGFGVTR